MTVCERLRKLRLERGMSQEELALRVGYGGRSAVSKAEKGERDISRNMLVKYAEALGVSPSYLLTGDEGTESIGRRIPLLGSIACGQAIFAEEDRGVYVDPFFGVDADFCLEAKGDSMIGARIADGDIVFIRRQEIVNDGEIAAVLIGDEATLKRVYYDRDSGVLSLFAENPAYRPMRFMGEELNSIRILGKAVAFRSIL